MSSRVKKRSDKREKTNKGFSLVELLAVIVIIGIISVVAVGGVTRYIDGARSEKISQNRKNVSVAAEMYVQNNRNLLPQNIGDHTRIPLSVLRSSNYLKEDVENEKGESCMEESVVRIYKFDEDDYSYTTYLYCGDEKAPADDPVPEPVVTDFKFSSSKDDVRNASVSFTIKGAENDDTIGIYSYRYIISVKNSSNDGESYNEIFNSEYLKGGLEPTIKIASKSLSSYVNLTGYTLFKVDIEVINEQGGKLSWSGNNSLGEFEDNDKPVCGNFYGDDVTDNDWINKISFGAGSSVSDGKRVYPGRISVECSDGNGSGCKRDLFTKTWPNDEMSDSGKVNYKYGARWSYITISDNAVNTKNGNNTTKCYVRVNVDVQSPSVKLYAYNAKSYESDRKNKSNAVASISVSDSTSITAKMPEGTIEANQFKNATGTGNEKWLNLADYPDGIIIDADVTDNLYLYHWTWEVNDAYVAGGTSNSNVSSSYGLNNSRGENGSKYEGYFSTNLTNGTVTNDQELAKEELGDTTGSISGLKLYLEGKRYGRLTVYDKAGNSTIIHVYANLDRTAPPVPIVAYKKQKTGGAYDPADGSNYLNHDHWSNEKLYAYVAAQRDDHEAPNTRGTELSGWDHFTYQFWKQTGKNGNNLTWSDVVKSDTSKVYDFGMGIEVNDEGTHKIQYRSCDKAGNCSAYSTLQYPKVDTIKPTCDIQMDYKGTKGPNAAGWLKLGESVVLSHTCQDEDSKFSSGCNAQNKDNLATFTYDFDIDTKTAGVNGDNKGGVVYDYAGNVSNECPKNRTVRVDHTIPTCTVKATYSGTTGPNAAGWLKIGENVTLTHPCTDPKTNGINSGCDDNNVKNKQFKLYNTDINTTAAGSVGVNNGGTVMDIAGNESKECPKMTVKIDHTAPTCNTTIDYPNGAPTSYGWLGDKQTAVVAKSCQENVKNNVSSGCDSSRTENFTSYTYNKEISTTSAGAGGNGNSGGKVYDIAGNASPECPKNKTVRIDYTYPSCDGKVTYDSSTGSSYRSGSYGNQNWTNRNLFITAVCTEKGSIKSGCEANLYDAYRSNIDQGIYFDPSHSVNAHATDKAGNTTNCDDYFYISIDNVRPTVVCSVGGHYYSNNNPSNSFTVSNSSYDDFSGVQSTSYSMDGAGYSSSNSRSLSCASYARNAGATVKVTDKAGNTSTGTCSGSVYVPGCCDSQTEWRDGTTCTDQCGNSGTYNQMTYSNYNNQVCQTKSSGGSPCNRRDCCSKTYSSGGDWCTSSSGCGRGTHNVYDYSSYNNQYCGTHSEGCDTGVACKQNVSASQYCGMYINSHSGNTVYFTSNGTCDIYSVSGGSRLSNTRASCNCSSSCTVTVTWTSGKYLFNGSEYGYTSWTTKKLTCSGKTKYCTNGCGGACVG